MSKLTIAIKKCGKSVEVPALPEGFAFDGIRPDTLAHVYQYGWKQLLNDATVQAGKAPADDASADDKATYTANAFAFVEKRRDNVLAGTFRAARESDPVAAEAMDMALATVKSHPEYRKLDLPKQKAIAAKYAVTTYYVEKATARIADLAAAMGAVEVDLSDLDLG